MKTVEQILGDLSECTPEDRCRLIAHLVQGLWGDDPDEARQELPLQDADGLTFAYIVASARRYELVERTEEQWRERLAITGDESRPTVPEEEDTRRLLEEGRTKSMSCSFRD